METYGKHILIELNGCDFELLDDENLIVSVLTELAQRIGAIIVEHASHRFSPYGVTAMFLIQESHLSIHTWPEAGYAALDFYTCGDVVVSADCVKWVANALSSQEYRTFSILRGCQKRVPTMAHEFDCVI